MNAIAYFRSLLLKDSENQKLPKTEAKQLFINIMKRIWRKQDESS